MADITNEMYAKLPNLVFGFHGCHKSIYNMVVTEGRHLKPSENDYEFRLGL